MLSPFGGCGGVGVPGCSNNHDLPAFSFTPACRKINSDALWKIAYWIAGSGWYVLTSSVAAFTSKTVQLNADNKARLPNRFGGLGHTSAVLIAPVAFYSSYAHHVALDKTKSKHLLAPEVNFCLDHIQKEVPRKTSDLLELLPKSSLDMWRKPEYLTQYIATKKTN